MTITQKTYLRKTHRLWLVAAVFPLAMLIFAAFIFAYAKPKVARRSNARLTIPAQDPTKSVSSKERIASELITLGPNGFEPATLTRTPGKFLLAIDNRSGLDDLSFELDRINGARERAARLAGNRVRWREVVDLSPGDYLVRVAGHSAWSCRIRITEKVSK